MQTTIEVTAARTTISYAKSADWGWWNPEKYDDWQTGEDKETGLAEARLLLTGDVYTVVLNLERYPTLEAAASRTDEETGAEINHELTTEFEAYDLALAQWFGGKENVGIMPWFGVTYMQIKETRATLAESTDGTNRFEDRARSRLWGALLGADWRARLKPRLLLSGRMMLRWGWGNREATISSIGPDAGAPAAVEAQLSDDVSRAMWGADFGLRWEANRHFQLEGGWRYRDWRYDNGPASFNGPFLRLVLVL
ncbi:MAG: hypothetical protein ACC742_13025 [Thermoanaerobaculales bacterium]